MKKNNFGKCTQEATRKELAKELRVNKSQIALLESSYREESQKLFGEISPAPIHELTFEVRIPFGVQALSMIGHCSVMVFDTERVGIVNTEYDRTDVILYGAEK